MSNLPFDYEKNVSQKGGRGNKGKFSNNPMQLERLAQSPRCLARTRLGAECQSPAVNGKRRCRMHGGTNPGAPKGNRNARKHGAYSAKAKAAADSIRALARLM